MRDEEIRESEPLLEIEQQIDDLRLHRDVERRDGLVADDERRLEREGARQPDALALAAAEFVRILPIAAGSRPTSSNSSRTRACCVSRVPTDE